ncbi:hypothetical protein ACFU99_01915 [Streptomyces sp. NPDC057654]|uniref:hypothetical protein n=1 Tax=Streptomyces sp. NPDC057654 TaxID=3346196 RepID=UPI0036BCB60F
MAVPRWLVTQDDADDEWHLAFGNIASELSFAVGSFSVYWIDPGSHQAPLDGARFSCEKRRKVAQPGALAQMETQYADDARRALAWLRADIGEAARTLPYAEAALLTAQFRDRECVKAHFHNLGFRHLTLALTVTARGYSTTWRIRRRHRTGHGRPVSAPPRISESRAAA